MAVPVPKYSAATRNSVYFCSLTTCWFEFLKTGLELKFLFLKLDPASVEVSE
jgi:hypothetical protein